MDRELVIRHVWTPVDPASGGRPVAYATERRRDLVATALIAACIATAVVAFGFGVPTPVAFIPLLVACAAVGYAAGGRTGFYELGEDGVLGAYLGRSPPDLSSMRREEKKPQGFLRKK